MFRTARSIWRYRSLLATLTSRELKARYRGSVLGYVWSLINPLLLLSVYTFVFSFIFDSRNANAEPYALFLITGLFPWIWFQASLTEGAGSLLANSGLIRKATFPAELLPMVPVLSNLVHFALALPVIGLAFLAFHWRGYDVGGWSMLLLPLVVLIQLPLVAGLSLGLAALNAHFKDVKDILANVLTLLFFMTPILYSLTLLEPFRGVHTLVSHNPLTPATLAFQQTLFFGRVPPTGVWLEMGLVSVLAWAAGTWLFERLKETLVEAV